MMTELAELSPMELTLHDISRCRQEVHSPHQLPLPVQAAAGGLPLGRSADIVGAHEALLAHVGLDAVCVTQAVVEAGVETILGGLVACTACSINDAPSRRLVMHKEYLPKPAGWWGTSLPMGRPPTW